MRLVLQAIFVVYIIGMKSLDKKDILKRAKIKPHRIKVSFTFPEGLYESFRLACEKDQVAASRVLEELLKAYLDTK